jgi:hypothetical protein
MSLKLASHNDDLRRLVEKGYAIAIDGAHMIVRDIPYLDNECNLQWGAFVTKLVFVNQERVQQDDHQIYFTGSAPHNIDGSLVSGLSGGPHTITLSDGSKDIVVQRSFSNKRIVDGQKIGYVDFFEKIENYVALVAGPAMNKYDANPLTFKLVQDTPFTSVFKFQDTLTSRAEISDLACRLEQDVIAIIGLGGTGSYLLDYMVKTPVKEIRAFDMDAFHVHNAFRSPGKLDENELGKTKAEVYFARYSNFRDGLSIHPKFIDNTADEELSGVTFAFVCVDKGSARSAIMDLLIAKEIPFIDVGMGLSRAENGSLKGMMRVTYFPVELAQKIREEQLVDTQDAPENIYRSNIQISELNAMNASLAMMRYKQVRLFFAEDDPYYHLIQDVRDQQPVKKYLTDENST